MPAGQVGGAGALQLQGLAKGVRAEGHRCPGEERGGRLAQDWLAGRPIPGPALLACSTTASCSLLQTTKTLPPTTTLPPVDMSTKIHWTCLSNPPSPPTADTSTKALGPLELSARLNGHVIQTQVQHKQQAHKNTKPKKKLFF